MDGTDAGAEEHFEAWMAQTLVRRIVGRCVERVEKRRREEEHFEEGVTCMFEVTPGRWGQKWRVTERRRRTLTQLRRWLGEDWYRRVEREEARRWRELRKIVRITVDRLTGEQEEGQEEEEEGAD